LKKLALLLVVAAFVFAPVSAQALTVGDWGGWPTVGTQFNDNLSGYLGYSYFGSTSTSWVLAKLDYNLAKMGDVQTKAGVYYTMTSPNSGTSLGLTWGASIMAVKNLSVGFDVILARANGTPSSTDVLPFAVITANLIL
jgi:hypothetical protein